ncbi:hypothetical protein [Adhaeretor mobilis]|uniref:Uncharacterized protein n=1 Tax=Adhaeretor mobilis TaxID=1930276 RepID=A0A517MUA6_9BACT|nr:hypothetical protein [Adhaeretor mobilis]QDS98466.1 hypothetical protein HG15A2_17460 [Adhaeretor mobilis]
MPSRRGYASFRSVHLRQQKRQHAKLRRRICAPYESDRNFDASDAWFFVVQQSEKLELPVIDSLESYEADH